MSRDVADVGPGTVRVVRPLFVGTANAIQTRLGVIACVEQHAQSLFLGRR
jgi:hypothetical protein